LKNRKQYKINNFMKGVFALILSKDNLSNSSGRRLYKGVIAFAVALLIFLAFTAPVLVQASQSEINVNLQISASWGGGDILNLDIADLDTGKRQQVAIRLSDFINEGENVPYILLQAMDLLGERQSGVIQIENPLFDPGRMGEQQAQLATSPNRVQAGATVGNSGSALGVDELPEDLQNIVADANQSDPTPPQTLTPDGTGTVVDNIMTVNNIEFFTIATDNGSDFFLVVDRQRTSNNVYLLNTVTEADLMALAEARGEALLPSSNNVSAIQPPVTPDTSETSPALTLEEILQAIQEANEQQNQQATTPAPQGGSSGIILLILFVLLLGGGGFAVWKILLPKLQSMGQGNQEEIEEDEDEYENDDEDGDEHFAIDYDNVVADEDEDEGEYADFNQDSSYDEEYSDSHGENFEDSDFEVSGGDADEEK